MRYSTWGKNRWDIHWTFATDKGVNEQALHIDYTFKFTYRELKYNLNGCLNQVRNYYEGNVSAEELEELVSHIREFIIDMTCLTDSHLSFL